VKNTGRSKREFALPFVKTVSPWGDVPTRATNRTCRVGALHPPAHPGQGRRGGWQPPTLHLLRKGVLKPRCVPRLAATDGVSLLRFARNDRAMCGSVRGANRTCRVGALHPPAHPGQGRRGGWKPPTLHLIRHSRLPRRTDLREVLVPESKRLTMTNPPTPTLKGR